MITVCYKVDPKTGENTKQIDGPKTLAWNKDFDPQQLKLFLLYNTPGWFTQNIKNIDHLLLNLGFQELPEFQFKIPEHILKSQNPKHKAICQHILTWMIPNLDRRQALILYSPPNTGKTRFVESLVNDPRYLFRYRSGISPDALENLKHARLMLFDDSKIITADQTEEWKAFMSGQEATIRAAWVNAKIPGLPLFICTNSIRLVSKIMRDREYDGRYAIIELDNVEEDYLGPAGTYKAEYTTPGLIMVSSKTLDIIAKDSDEFEVIKQNKKNALLFPNSKVEPVFNSEVEALKRENNRLKKQNLELQSRIDTVDRSQKDIRQSEVDYAVDRIKREKDEIIENLNRQIENLRRELEIQRDNKMDFGLELNSDSIFDIQY